jgi:hypothetical protein
VLLRLLMALLAMEIGAGLALYEARRLGSVSGDDPGRIAEAQKAVEATMLLKLEELKRLENASAVFQNEGLGGQRHRRAERQRAQRRKGRSRV